MRLYLTIVPILAALIAGCRTAEQRAIVSAPASVTVELTSLGTNRPDRPHLIKLTKQVRDQKKSNNEKVGAEPEIDLNTDDANKEILVSNECAVDVEDVEEVEAFPVAAIIGFAVTELVSFLVDAIDDALQEELKKYTQAFGGNVHGQFYEAGSATELGHKCLRVIRTYKKDPEDPEDTEAKEFIAMDFVAAVDVQPPAALRIQPLRLYYFKAQALTDQSRTYGVSIGLTVDAMWRTENAPKHKDGIVDAVIFADQITLKPNEYVYHTYKRLGTFEPTEEKSPLLLPLVPWSHYGNISEGATSVKATMTVTEVGNIPWWLEKGADLFHKNKDKINEQIQAAIAQLLKDQAEIDISE